MKTDATKFGLHWNIDNGARDASLHAAGLVLLDVLILLYSLALSQVFSAMVLVAGSAQILFLHKSQLSEGYDDASANSPAERARSWGNTYCSDLGPSALVQTVLLLTGYQNQEVCEAEGTQRHLENDFQIKTTDCCDKQPSPRPKI